PAGRVPGVADCSVNQTTQPGQRQSRKLFFVVTDPRRVIKFYNGRGTAEQWIKEGKNALNRTRLSCRRFKDNQVRLQLFALAYNLANFLRQLALPRSVQTWTRHFLNTGLSEGLSVDNSRRDVCNRGRDSSIALDGASRHAH